MPKHIFILIIFSVSIFAQSPSDKREQEAKKVYSAWIQTITQQDFKNYQSLCTKGFNESNVDNSERFYSQAIRKKFDLKVTKNESNQDRFAFHVDIERNGRRVDQIYVYLTKQNEKWYVDGLSENKKITQYFLSGTISGHFHPQNLASLPELDQIGQNLQSNNKEKLGNVYGDLVKEFINGTYTFKSSHFSPAFKIGILQFEIIEQGPKGASRESVYFFLRQDERGWEVYSKKRWVSAQDFLEQDISQKEDKKK